MRRQPAHPVRLQPAAQRDPSPRRRQVRPMESLVPDRDSSSRQPLRRASARTQQRRETLMAKSFDILRADLNKRLDALPDGEGDRIRERTREQIEAEETAYASSLAELRKARTLTQ